MGSEFSYNKYEEIDLEQLVQLRERGNVLIIDVRGRSELDRTGTMAGSINIPFLELSDTLAKTPHDFHEIFGMKKPSKDTIIVFFCQSGGRSEAASQLTAQLGYKNVKNFSGGWTAWETSQHMDKF